MNFLMRIFGDAKITPVSHPFPSDNKSGKKINFLFSCMHAISEEEARQIFERWMVENKRRYNDVREKEKRFEVFKQNMRKIEKHNSDPNNTSTLGLTQFADLSSQEFSASYATYGNGCWMDRRILDLAVEVDGRNHISWNFFGVFSSSGN